MSTAEVIEGLYSTMYVYVPVPAFPHKPAFQLFSPLQLSNECNRRGHRLPRKAEYPAAPCAVSALNGDETWKGQRH